MIMVSLWTVISDESVEYEARIETPEEFSARAENPGLAFRRVREIAKRHWSVERMKYLDLQIKEYKKRYDYRCAVASFKEKEKKCQ